MSGRANDWEVRACSEQDSWLHWSPCALDRFFTSIAFPRVSPLLLIFLHCITLNRAAGVLPVVSSIKKQMMCLEKGSLFRKCQPGWEKGGLVSSVCGFTLLFFISTVWLHIMSPITMNIPSVSRSRVMRFPNYCHLSKRFRRRGFLFLMQSLWGRLKLASYYHQVC